MSINSKYIPGEIENKWYKYWMENNMFKSVPDERESYSIVIPPPNVTGVLHMGHMLNNTIQDVLIRRARLLGYNACWVPGTDHASIATEAKVVSKLKSEGIEKSDLTKEEFLKHAWEWTDKHGGIILEQLKKLGASCDWDRTKFTMDEDMSKSVSKVFVDLYNKGLIYRGFRMVNWDPEALTTVSDEEVNHIEKQGKLYYLNYNIKDSEETITIATTRPETILGDVAICVNPNDDRYKHLHDKTVIVPIANREIPIITDEYVDLEFGTGCLKITPAHDVNDKEIGDKHDLPIIDIFNDNATLNKHGLHYEGKDRFVVRKEIVIELEEKGFVNKIEDYTNKVGTSERTGAVIEPKLSVQWFLKMKELAEPAIKAVNEKDVQLVPEKFINTYNHWMNNVRDWNISRQLWWGHEIPAYYYGSEFNQFVVAETKDEALELAKKKSKNNELTLDDLTQDPDALDTWFSSWLWPISVFDGINNPKNEEIEYYYPTQALVTGPDILFFWVARMIVAGYEYMDKKPFSSVYLTGIVRDSQGRKMSKSLGNSPDPVELINEFGADAVRMGLLLTAPAGNDLPFNTDLCIQGRNFNNKIWNAFRLIKAWEIDNSLPQPESSRIAIEWFNNKMAKNLEKINDSFDKFRLSEALMETYKLIWDDFCSWYLEMIKPSYQAPIDAKTIEETITIFENLLKILHPFSPFVSEEIYHLLKNRNKGESIMLSQWPKFDSVNEELLYQFENQIDVTTQIRTIRKKNNIPQKESLALKVLINSKENKQFDSIIKKLNNLNTIEYVSIVPDENTFSFVSNQNEFFIPSGDLVDTEAEIKKMEEELAYTKGFLKSVDKKLSNERFVTNAPDKVIEIERKKQSDAVEKIKVLENKLSLLTK